MSIAFSRLVAAAFLLAALVPCTVAQNATSKATSMELTIGAVKQQAEAAAVRALMKFGDSVSVVDHLVRAGDPVFYEITRKVEFDATDKGTFGGLSLRHGFKAYKVPIITEEVTLPNGAKAIASRSNGWMHVFPVTLGLDADRNFKNRDVLLEAGYVPFYGNAKLSCFKLGANPILGLVGQLGHRTRDPATAQPDEPRSLRRIKFEALTAFRLDCLNPKDEAAAAPAQDEADDGTSLAALFLQEFGRLRDWQILAEARVWRDFSLDETFRKSSLTLRVPAGKGMFMDFKREVGTGAPDFAKGSQFGAYLTVQF